MDTNPADAKTPNWSYAIPVLIVLALMVRCAGDRTPDPPAPGPPGVVPSGPAGRDPSQVGRKGPFIRIDQANDVAAHFRGLGYNASVVYLGTLENRTYAVDVW